MKVICSSEESLYRPEAVRWRQRMELMKPLGDTVVLLPCSMKKPYSNSKSHQKFRKVSRSFQELIITSPFGICPRELENTFPIQSYDVAVTGSWSQDEIDESGKLLEKYVKSKNVIANVHGGYEEVCRRFLADEEDFSEEKIEKAGIKKRFENNNLNQCIKEIEQEIVKKIK